MTTLSIKLHPNENKITYLFNELSPVKKTHMYMLIRMLAAIHKDIQFNFEEPRLELHAENTDILLAFVNHNTQIKNFLTTYIISSENYAEAIKQFNLSIEEKPTLPAKSSAALKPTDISTTALLEKFRPIWQKELKHPNYSENLSLELDTYSLIKLESKPAITDDISLKYLTIKNPEKLRNQKTYDFDSDVPHWDTRYHKSFEACYKHQLKLSLFVTEPIIASTCQEGFVTIHISIPLCLQNKTGYEFTYFNETGHREPYYERHYPNKTEYRKLANYLIYDQLSRDIIQRFEGLGYVWNLVADRNTIHIQFNLSIQMHSHIQGRIIDKDDMNYYMHSHLLKAKEVLEDNSYQKALYVMLGTILLPIPEFPLALLDIIVAYSDLSFPMPLPTSPFPPLFRKDLAFFTNPEESIPPNMNSADYVESDEALEKLINTLTI